jgi:hypothetical protein
MSKLVFSWEYWMGENLLTVSIEVEDHSVDERASEFPLSMGRLILKIFALLVQRLNLIFVLFQNFN